MNTRMILAGKGKIPSIQYLLATSRVSSTYNAEVVVELYSSTSKINLLNEIESQSGKTIDKIKVDIRVIIPQGVVIEPYQHIGATGVDAIDMTGIPSDKSIIIENYGTIAGSGGKGSQGSYSGSNQTRNGSVGHGGSCFKLVNLEKLILINYGNLHGGKGVGANGSGGRGGNATWGSTSGSYSYGVGCSVGSWNAGTPIVSSSIGQGGNGGEWDGYGYSSWTRGLLNGSTNLIEMHLKYSGNVGSGCTPPYQTYVNQAMGKTYAGAGSNRAYSNSMSFSGSFISFSIMFNVPSGFPPNGGAGGSAGGKGSIASGYGKGANGGSGGSAGGSGGAGATSSISGTLITFTDGADNGGQAGSAGSAGAKGNGGGILTSATIGEYSVVNNGTILSGKDLDGNTGGYLL